VSVTRRFLIAAAAWTAIIAAPMILLELVAANDDGSRYIRLLARAVMFAGFPAGVAAAQERPGRSAWRWLIALGTGAGVVALIAFGLAVWDRGLTWDVVFEARPPAVEGAWEHYNDAAWHAILVLLAPVFSGIYSTLGVQVGLWSAYSVPPAFRPALLWAIALGLVISGFAVTDTVYETVILHTSGDARFAALVPLLFPLGLATGFALPTLAWLRGRVAPTTSP
jgi:hypothetical protein